MQEIEEAFSAITFEQTITRILELLNYNLDEIKKKGGNYIGIFRGRLQEVKKQLEEQINDPNYVEKGPEPEENLTPISNMTCRNGHKLVWTNEARGCYCESASKEGCGERINVAQDGYFRCKERCNFDLCVPCGRVPETKETCEKGKPLVYKVHAYPSHYPAGYDHVLCDVCRKKIKKDVAYWRCECPDHNSSKDLCKKHGQCEPKEKEKV
jgi:hypothetical protein